MIDLDPVAEALVKKLVEYRDAAEDAAETLEALRGAIEDHEKELEEDWSSLTEAIESLLGVAGEHAGRLDPQGDEAGGTVEGLAGLISQVQESVVPSLDENEELLNTLRDQAAGADVEVERLVAGAAEAPAEGVSEQFDAIAQGVAKTAEEGVESIREGFVKEAEEAVEMAEMLVEASVKILTEGGTWVRQAVVAWTAKLGEVEDSVALEGFRKASQQAPEVVDYALDALGSAQQAGIDEVERLVSEAKAELASLEESLRESSESLGGASEVLEDQAAAFGSAISAAGEALQRVTEVLASRGAM